MNITDKMKQKIEDAVNAKVEAVLNEILGDNATKKHMGRPFGSKNKKKAKIGRPPGSVNKPKEKGKRRGRPPGSKNKPKVDKPDTKAAEAKPAKTA